MLPNAFVCHESLGRVRVRIREKKYDLDYFSRTQATLSKLHYTDWVEIKALTASILIKHNTELKTLLSDAEELGLFGCALDAQATDAPSPVLTEAMQSPWMVKGLLALGTLQILRGSPLAPASTLLMDAYRLWLANRNR